MNGVTVSGTWDMKPRRGDGAGVRFMRLLAKLNEVKASVGVIDRVIYELPGTFKSCAADDVIRGMVAHIQSWAEHEHIPYEGVSPTEVKKFATGKGGGSGTDKAAMVELAKKRWGSISNHNEADALFILAMVTEGRME